MEVSRGVKLNCASSSKTEPLTHIHPCIQGIELKNQSIPSGIYSALEEANVTASIFDSYNDVNLRWIGNDNWMYSLVFDGIFRQVKFGTFLRLIVTI